MFSVKMNRHLLISIKLLLTDVESECDAYRTTSTQLYQTTVKEETSRINNNTKTVLNKVTLTKELGLFICDISYKRSSRNSVFIPTLPEYATAVNLSPPEINDLQPGSVFRDVGTLWTRSC